MIVLASKSPRRRDLLEQVGLKSVRVIPASGEEKVDEELPPARLVGVLSKKKALEVAKKVDDDDIVIAADTVVVFDGVVMGKPKDDTDAFAMLATLSGNVHTVYTGVTVACGDELLTAVEETEVKFRELSSDEIEAYIRTGEPEDKAGAYGIQGAGALLVERVEGDYYNVVGLPLCRLSSMLKQLGVDLLERA